MQSVALVADVGNSRLKLAILDSGRRDSGSLPRWLESFLHRGQAPCDWQALRQRCDESNWEIRNCLISGSAWERMEQLVAEWPDDFPTPRVIQSARELPITLSVDEPDKVGVDRVLNAVAVNHLRQVDQPGIIVDAGTAITIDAVAGDGRFLGGAILPGYELEAHALHDYTSRLPFIPMEQIIGDTPAVIGRNTHDALRSGLIWGQLGAVHEIVSRMTAEISGAGTAAPAYFLTGGAAPLLEPHLQLPFQAYPQLTLQGLGLLAE